MKIGILTIFRSGNYGATLQAYALREAVNLNGFGEADIIPYRCDALKGKIDGKFIKKAGLFRTAVACVEKMYYHPRMKKVNAFVNSYAGEKDITLEELKALNDVYDIFLSGSDQLWNPDIQHGDYSYLLDFVTDDHKKRSYASSFGRKDVPEAYRETYRDLLSRYHKMTVREENGARLVKELIGREVPVVLDPALLLTPAQWEAHLEKPICQKPYVFTYQMAHSSRMAKITAACRKTLGGKSLFVPFPIGGMCRCSPRLGLSSFEWLQGIHDAEFVITDSFHGAVFSILFSKPFYYVITSDTVRVRLSRLETLLSTLHLEDRLVESVEQCDFSKPIDYTAVHETLTKERERSLAILKELTQ